MTVAIPHKSISPVNVDERKNLDIRSGDIVRIHQKIQEKGKTRIQLFEGLVLARKHGTEAGATFTVRATMSGVGVEKIFPLYSPGIDKIEIVRRSKMRRAKLYFIRDQVARVMRKQLRNMRSVAISTKSEREEADKAVAEAAALKEAQEKEAAEIAAKAAAKEAEAKAKAEAVPTSDGVGTPTESVGEETKSE